MKTSWALQDAKNRFSEVVETTLREGPQTVTRYGTPVVVIMAVKDYEKSQRPKDTLVEFFRNSPLYGVELDLTRSRDTGREVEL
ncbi:MAG: type II toxin-antitoxin system Phd/YefM family antitoxin [Kiritimatiellaeota bacterium]|nr:type II toxin-antitoxin system Phd/YefM family antitoxin [Kiritimatiellota bacterium]